MDPPITPAWCTAVRDCRLGRSGAPHSAARPAPTQLHSGLFPATQETDDRRDRAVTQLGNMAVPGPLLPRLLEAGEWEAGAGLDTQPELARRRVKIWH